MFVYLVSRKVLRHPVIFVLIFIELEGFAVQYSLKSDNKKN